MTTRARETQLVFDADTDVGRSRQGKPNQDSIGTYQDYCDDAMVLAAKGKLFVVADGMGGAAGGKEASTLAVDTIVTSFYADPDEQLVPCLERAIQAANAAIHQHGRAQPELRGMGTTVVLAAIRDQQLVVGNVGDSRAYLLRGDELTQLSLDHTSVQEQVRAGVLTPDEAAVHPRRHVLSRNLGYRPQAQPDFDTRLLRPGDTILLCSDGLWGSVEDHELAAVLRKERGEHAVEALINLANERGGPDNISAIVIHVEQLGAVKDHASARSAALVGATTESHAATANGSGESRATAIPSPAPKFAATGTKTGEPLPPTRLRSTTRPAEVRAAHGMPSWSVALIGVALLVLLGGAYLTWTRLAPRDGTGTEPVTSGSAAQAAAPTAEPSGAASFAAKPTTAASATSVSTSAPTAMASAAASKPGASVDAALSLPAAPLQLAQPSEVMSLAVSRDNQLLATGGQDGSVQLWRASDGARMGSFTADSAPITSLAFSADGLWLASASDGASGSVKLWSLQPPAASGLADFQFHNAASISRPFVKGVAFAPDGQLASVAQDTALSIWKLPLLDAAATFPGPVGGARDVVVAADGRTLAIVDPEQGLQLWSGAEAPSNVPAWQPQHTVLDIALAADGKTLAVSESDGTVTVWRAHEASVRQRYVTSGQLIMNVALSSDGRWLLVAQRNGTVEWWSVDEIDLLVNDGPAKSVPPPLPMPRP